MMVARKIGIIAYYTFNEILKSKILLSVVVIGFAMACLVYVATEFTFGVPGKVALDFGLGMLSLSNLGIALFLGATLLPKEIDSRTVYMVISRPVPRYAFIIGKILGLFGILVVNFLLLSFLTLSVTGLMGGNINGLVLWAIGFSLIECLLLLLITVLFSLYTNNILSSLAALVLLILGHAVQEALTIEFVAHRPLLGSILKFYHFVLPAFYKLNLKDIVLYKQSLGMDYLVGATLYGLSYSAFVLVLIVYVFNRKNLD
jgi:ABC-2 type transport system permease protein